MAKTSKTLQEKDLELLGIKSLIDGGRITKMADFMKLSPTKLAKALSINYGRYIAKLTHPEKFTVGEIVKMAATLEVDKQILFNIASQNI